MINNMPVPEPRQIPRNLQNGLRSEVPQVDIDVELRNIRNLVERLPPRDRHSLRSLSFTDRPFPVPADDEIEAPRLMQAPNPEGNADQDDFVILAPPPPLRRQILRRHRYSAESFMSLDNYCRNAARNIQLLSQHYNSLSRDAMVPIFQSMHDATIAVDEALNAANIRTPRH